jgi:pectinesterase
MTNAWTLWRRGWTTLAPVVIFVAGCASASSRSSAETGGDAVLGTATRPQLSDLEAAEHTVQKYLEKSGDLAGLVADGWDPTGGVGDVASFTARFTVASEGGSHASVQAAIDAAVSAGGERVYIEMEAGTYRETVCVPRNAPPITLYSRSSDAAETVIVFDNFSGKEKQAGAPANLCNPNTDGTTFGTSGSATFAAYAPDFQAKNLTFANDTDEAAAGSSVQAVALMTQADRLVFENVRVLGNQDTLLVKTPDVTTVWRAYFKDCYVEGDTDFVFGRGTAVLDGCTIHSLTSRTANGVVVAPSTDSRNPYGILVAKGTFTADAAAEPGSTHLGRAWDEGQVDVPTYVANVASGVYPNGQALVRESVLGVHVQGTAPWRSAATTSRPHRSSDGDYPANRLFEYGNSGPGSVAP